MQNRDQVSVIIPCYNQARFLGEAIDSVLAQTFRNYEIIVVDDGSTDDTRLTAESFDQVRYLRQINRGLASARNVGLRTSNGNYVVFLDADDRLLSNALQDGVEALKARPDCAFSYGHVNLIASDGSPLPTPHQVPVRENHYLELLRHNYIWTTGAVVYRRKVLESVGDFNVSLSGSADFDLNTRITRVFPVCCVDTTVLEYRRHNENMSRDYALMLRNAVAVRLNQRRLVRGRQAFETALRTGILSAQADYGEKLLDLIGVRLREGNWKAAIAGLAILARYYPRGFIKRARRKLSSRAGTSRLVNMFRGS